MRCAPQGDDYERQHHVVSLNPTETRPGWIEFGGELGAGFLRLFHPLGTLSPVLRAVVRSSLQVALLLMLGEIQIWAGSLVQEAEN